jgi:hypothetical protein
MLKELSPQLKKLIKRYRKNQNLVCEERENAIKNPKRKINRYSKKLLKKN